MEAKIKKNKTYIRLADQSELIKLTHEIDPESWLVCHFFRPGDKRCRQLENHLKILAAKHPETKFCALNAAKAPWIMSRLNIFNIAEICIFRGIHVKGVIFGYSELQNGDCFSTEMIENRIAEDGAINYQKPKKNKRRPKMTKSMAELIFSPGTGGADLFFGEIWPCSVHHSS